LDSGPEVVGEDGGLGRAVFVQPEQLAVLVRDPFLPRPPLNVGGLPDPAGRRVIAHQLQERGREAQAVGAGFGYWRGWSRRHGLMLSRSAPTNQPDIFDRA